MKKEIQYYYQAEVCKGRSKKQNVVNILSSVEVEIPEVQTAPVVMGALLKTIDFSIEKNIETLEDKMIFRKHNDDLYVSFYERERDDLLDSIETIMDVWGETSSVLTGKMEFEYNRFFNFSGDFPYFNIKNNPVVEEKNIDESYRIISSNKEWIEESIQKGFSKNFMNSGKMYIPSGLPVMFQTHPYNAYHIFSRLKPLRTNDTNFYEVFKSDRSLICLDRNKKITKMNLPFHETDKILSLSEINKNDDYGNTYAHCNMQNFELAISDPDFIQYISEKTNYKNQIFFLRMQNILNKININPSSISTESLENLIQFKLSLKQMSESFDNETTMWCATQMKNLVDELNNEKTGKNIKKLSFNLYNEIANPKKDEFPLQITKNGNRISFKKELEQQLNILKI